MVLNKSDNDDPVSSLIEKYKPVLSKITLGSFLGYCSGVASKKIGKAVAAGIGLLFVAVQSAANAGYIDVDWAKVEKDVISKIDTDADGKITKVDLKKYWEKVKSILTYNMPSASGFSIGFFYGLKA